MTTRSRAADDVIVEELAEELCLMRLATNDVLVLNRTASDVWLLASDGMDGPAVSAALAAAYDVPLTDVAGHVTETLAVLLGHGFLVESS